ncbi:MAG: DoxX family protein [Gemmatimonadaceae bacterium]
MNYIAYSDTANVALLIARVAIGLGFAAHGAQKLLGWFGGSGINKTGEFMIKLGWRQGKLFGTLASSSETVGGSLIALGFLWPLGPALLILMMVTAAITVHMKNGFFNGKNGWELNMVYGMSALILTFTGPGDYSLDRFAGLDWLYNANYDVIAVVIAIAIGLINAFVFRKPPEANRTSDSSHADAPSA